MAGWTPSYWKDLAPRLAKTTGSKVITHDRAGEGESDEVSGPWRVENAVSDLEAGLEELGVTKDVVLVSHSIAGEVATNFVVKNPGWVSGAVLVDANVPDFFTDGVLTAFEPVVEARRAALLEQESTKENRRLLAVLVDYAPVHRVFRELSWPEDVPVTVVVASETPFVDLPEAAAMWRDGQARFARGGPNRKHVVAENTSHEGIVTERPDVITGAVEDVVETVRQPRCGSLSPANAARTSSTKGPGCSQAARWPPACVCPKWTGLVRRRSVQRRDSRTTSSAVIVTPVGRVSGASGVDGGRHPSRTSSQ